MARDPEDWEATLELLAAGNQLEAALRLRDEHGAIEAARIAPALDRWKRARMAFVPSAPALARNAELAPGLEAVPLEETERERIGNVIRGKFGSALPGALPRLDELPERHCRARFGVIDLYCTLPPEHAGPHRATKHGRLVEWTIGGQRG